MRVIHLSAGAKEPLTVSSDSSRHESIHLGYLGIMRCSIRIQPLDRDDTSSVKFDSFVAFSLIS